MSAGWIGVDLDGTLAVYDGWRGISHIGAPVPAMLVRVRAWLDKGIPVRIVTARVCSLRSPEEVAEARRAIEKWCLMHVGQALPVTHEKDFGMIELWDDRAVSVETNTGRVVARDGRP